MRLEPQPNDHPTLAKVHWYATAQYSCSYLPKQQSRSQVAVLEPAQAPAAYNALIRQGFRRSGMHVYRPQCDHCNACQSVRIRVNEFAPTRSQRRATKILNALSIKQIPLRFDAEHWALYQRYQAARHFDDISDNEGSCEDGMAASTTHNNADDGANKNTNNDENSPQAYSQFLLRSHVDTCMVEFRLTAGEHKGLLYAVSIVDTTADGLSAVYTFFEPDAELTKTSPGTAVVMWMVAQSKALGLPYVYLGYWIKASRKMAYKSNFQPLDILFDGHWQPYQDK